MVKATAHQLARLIYAMLTKGQPYVERGIDVFEAQKKETVNCVPCNVKPTSLEWNWYLRPEIMKNLIYLNQSLK